MSIDFKKLEQQISLTGFPLEYNTEETFKSNDWTTISNRYYVDDIEGKVREIDLVAYKLDTIEDLFVYTVIIISCKKSQKIAWAFLTKDPNLSNPNLDWHPLHYWTNSKILEHLFFDKKKIKSLHKRVIDKGVLNPLKLPDVDVFSFQQIDLDCHRFTTENKQINDTITTLMKSQAYELESLPERKTYKCFYNFHLLSINDLDFVKLHFNGKTIEATAIDDIQTITRYIVNNKSTSARIRFIKTNIFSSVIEEYNKLHEVICEIIKEDVDGFYSSFPNDSVLANALIDYFREGIESTLKRELNLAFNLDLKITIELFRFNPDDKFLDICLSVPQAFTDFLNANELIISTTKTLLIDNYKYSGKFRYVGNAINF